MTKKPAQQSAEDIMTALRSALDECMGSYEFLQAILEGDKSAVLSIQGEDWYITYVHNKNISEDVLIVDLPVLTDEMIQQYEEMEDVDRRDRDTFITSIRESGCINELQEVMYERFEACIAERAHLMAEQLAAKLQNSPYITRPIEARLEARIIVNGVDLGDLLTLYRHLQDEDDFLGWLQRQLKDAKPQAVEDWSPVLKIVEGGLEANPQKVRAYAELLIEKLEKGDGQELIVRSLKRLLEGETGNLIYPATTDSSRANTREE